MSFLHPRTLAALLAAACVASALACGSSRTPSAQAAPPHAARPDAHTNASASTPNTQLSPAALRADSVARARARADSIRHPYTDADVRFMAGMIEHHAQAIVMADWAMSHGAGPSVRILAERIVNAQQDEMATAQQWLADRRKPVPRPDTTGRRVASHSGAHSMMMPGMLSPDQMRQLERTRGPDFDRLFLRSMIQHHRGAVVMVQDLFGSYGAGQDELIFKFASDVNVDQTTEIARMQRMLAALPPPRS